jgi:hypothetical protein
MRRSYCGARGRVKRARLPSPARAAAGDLDPRAGGGVFDLVRDVELHVRSQARYGETASADAPLLGLGEEVTFRARHFGLRFALTARITAYDRPHAFVDTTVRGPFRSLRHEHRFEERDGSTTMTDVSSTRCRSACSGGSPTASWCGGGCAGCSRCAPLRSRRRPNVRKLAP